jgi:hypothetical protein
MGGGGEGGAVREEKDHAERSSVVSMVRELCSFNLIWTVAGSGVQH